MPTIGLVLANQAWWKDRRAAGISPQPNSTYEENMRDLLAAGYYPEAKGQENSWLMARMDRRRNPSSPFEIETDDSSWRLVTDHHLTDGGIMTIITDITAQKRAEEAAEMPRIVTRLSNETVSIEDAARRCIVAVCGYADGRSGICACPATTDRGRCSRATFGTSTTPNTIDSSRMLPRDR